MRQLGELLGFVSTRPDNDQGTGPDVLWRDDEFTRQLGFELKTDKLPPARYFKKDIAQGHDHLEWMEKTYPDHDNLGLVYVGPDGRVDAKGNPSDQMSLCMPDELGSLRNEVLALVEDLRKLTPMERLIEISTESANDRWTLPTIIMRLKPKRLSK